MIFVGLPQWARTERILGTDGNNTVKEQDNQLHEGSNCGWGLSISNTLFESMYLKIPYDLNHKYVTITLKAKYINHGMCLDG